MRRDEPGYFVVLDERGREIKSSRRWVRAGFNRDGDRQIVFALTMEMSDHCEVVFRPNK